MKIINDKKYDIIWNKIDNDFKFKPSIDLKIIPFQFDINYVCYKLNNLWNEEQEKIVNRIFKKMSSNDIYALDWQHDCFEYNPNENIKLYYSYYDKNRNCSVHFPSYYPDGDYHFFISKDWTYGILGHPWRKEIYIFGEKLIKAFEECELILDITKK